MSFWSYTFNVLTKWSLVEKLSFPTILDTLLSINCISSSFELNLFGTVIAAFVSCSKTRGLVTSTGTTKKFIASRVVSGFKLWRYDKDFKLAYNWNLLIARFLPSLILRPPAPAELSFAISFVPSAPLIIRGSENEAEPAPLLWAASISNPDTTRLYLFLLVTPSCPSAEPSMLITLPPIKCLPLSPPTGWIISSTGTFFPLCR